MSLSEDLKQGDVPQEPLKLCDGCGNHTGSVAYCNTCPGFLCKICAFNHSVMVRFAAHKVVSFEESPVMEPSTSNLNPSASAWESSEPSVSITKRLFDASKQTTELKEQSAYIQTHLESMKKEHSSCINFINFLYSGDYQSRYKGYEVLREIGKQYDLKMWELTSKRYAIEGEHLSTILTNLDLACGEETGAVSENTLPFACQPNGYIGPKPEGRDRSKPLEGVNAVTLDVNESLPTPIGPKPYTRTSLTTLTEPKPYTYTSLTTPTESKPYTYTSLTTPTEPKPYTYTSLTYPTEPKPYTHTSLTTPTEPKPYKASAWWDGDATKPAEPKATAWWNNDQPSKPLALVPVDSERRQSESYQPNSLLTLPASDPVPVVTPANNAECTIQIRKTFGEKGNGPSQFNSPHGFCLGFEEDIVVADTFNHRVQVFDKFGNYKGQFGKAGRNEGCLWHPRKLAFVPRRRSYVVCDHGFERSRIQVFTATGQFVRRIKLEHVAIVAAVAVTRTEQIVLVDSVVPTIFIIGENNFLRTIDCTGFIKEPSDIAVAGDEIYISDFKGDRVVVFDEDGNHLRSFGNNKIINFPNGIDVSPRQGYVLTVDSHGNYVHMVVFREDGDFVADFRCPFVRVSRCCGVKWTSDKRLITVDKNSNKIIILEPLRIDWN